MSGKRENEALEKWLQLRRAKNQDLGIGQPPWAGGGMTGKGGGDDVKEL